MQKGGPPANRSGQRTKTGNNEIKSPTRKTDVWGTQFILSLDGRATRPIGRWCSKYTRREIQSQKKERTYEILGVVSSTWHTEDKRQGAVIRHPPTHWRRLGGWPRFTFAPSS